MIPTSAMPFRTAIALLVLLMMGSTGLLAQPVSRFDGQSGSFYPIWLPDASFVSSLDTTVVLTAPAFQGADYDEALPNLPFYDLVLPVSAHEEILIGEVSVEGETESFSNQFQRTWADSRLRTPDSHYPASHVMLAERITVMGETRQHLRLYPLRVSTDGARVQRVTTIHYRIQRRVQARKGGGGPANARTYRDHSVLASGTWHKLGITQTGIYQLDYDYLRQLGTDPATINPNTLRIHGNGGAALPQVAGAFPYDDLEENAIHVQGGADGRFDPGDYVLFFASGPTSVGYHPGYDQLYHENHLYADTAFYYLTWGGAAGKRITTLASEPNFTHTPTSVRRLAWHEDDRLNPIKSGRTWVGETFDLTTRQTFSIATPQAIPSAQVRVTVRAIAKSLSPSNMLLYQGGNLIGNLPLGAISTSGQEVRHHIPGTVSVRIPGSSIQGGTLTLDLEYVKQQSTAVAQLDYIEVDYEAALHTGGRPSYRLDALPARLPGQIDHFVIGGVDASHRVWDVSDPVNVRAQEGQLVGGNLEFNAAPGAGRHWYIFNGGYLRPVSASRIANQDLHSLAQADYLIVSHPSFLSAAERLAAHHRRRGLSVLVVSLPLIYQEFSSGSTDMTAIRDFVKMFYDRAQAGAGTPPRYLLLMGDGSHDPKGITHDRLADYIPTYQSRLSHDKARSYTSDDYLGFLDDGEGFWGEDATQRYANLNEYHWVLRGDTVVQTHGLDVAIGRLPVQDLAEAEAFVDKIVRYEDDPAGFGPWRNRVVLVADHLDSEGAYHVSQADSYSGQIAAANPCINIDKLYMDNYQMVPQASSQKFPDGRAAMLKAFEEGSLIVNYTGHGGEIAWSNSTILDISDIKQLSNGPRLPLFITATCQFGRWDDPERRSGAEGLVLQQGGGAIGMLTTVRTVYAGPNYALNQNFYDEVFRYDSAAGRMPTVGEIFLRTKNASWLNGINNRNFSLLGDPAMTLAYPQLRATITEVNGQPVDAIRIDSLGALTLVTLAGEVRDAAGQLQTGFNGDLSVIVFDKPAQFVTKRAPFRFFWQKNRIFNGSATVTGGRFNVQFVVPVDISYEAGLGKVSLYVQGARQDGAGCHSRIYPGGSSAGAIQDDQGPELTLYMNDEKFVDGGMVGTDPILLADVYDDYGLNTVGTGIGHELTAVLDGDDRHIHILNNAYVAARNSYQEGRITYPLQDLAPGPHQLDVKVWDVANNSASARVEFVVADDASMALGHVLNYPNPFTTSTKFIVEHNRNGSLLKLQVRIYTVSGHLVKTLENSFFAEGNLSCDLEWDGLDEYGDALGRGVYVYQVVLEDETRGGVSRKFEKLVVLR
jgi:hypothetical protein